MSAPAGAPEGSPSGRVAVVTGAARGIGAATVDRLVASGWSVVAVDVCADDPVLDYPMAGRRELQALADRHGDRVLPLVGDVRRQEDMAAAAAAARQEFGGLHAAVAVAGVMKGGEPLWEVTDAAWDTLFEVNVNGARRLAAAAVPVMLEQPAPRHGRFVAVASAAGQLGLRRLTAYAASKHAVIGLAKGLAADLAGTGVTANAVCPGSTRGVMLDESARIYGLSSAEEFAAQALLGRLLEPQEPAALVAWLCGEESSAVTGAALSADAGLTTS